MNGVYPAYLSIHTQATAANGSRTRRDGDFAWAIEQVKDPKIAHSGFGSNFLICLFPYVTYELRVASLNSTGGNGFVVVSGRRNRTKLVQQGPWNTSNIVVTFSSQGENSVDKKTGETCVTLKVGFGADPPVVFHNSHASFGPTDFAVDLTEAVVADPIDGCSAFANPAAYSGKVTIVKRGSCYFAQKAAFAQKSGAVALVVVNKDGTKPGEVIIMGVSAASDVTDHWADGCCIQIPIAMVDSIDGKSLLSPTAKMKISMYPGHIPGSTCKAGRHKCPNINKVTFGEFCGTRTAPTHSH